MKRTLYIAIIVIALGGAAVMAYMAFFGNGPGNADQIEIGAEAQQAYNILPKGKNLDFGELNDFNKDKVPYPYPVVSPSEIGQVLGNIIE